MSVEDDSTVDLFRLSRQLLSEARVLVHRGRLLEAVAYSEDALALHSEALARQEQLRAAVPREERSRSPRGRGDSIDSAPVRPRPSAAAALVVAHSDSRT
jgi:hypothetical protein